MNARRVNSAAGVIAAAMEQGKRTPAGLAVALDAACLLNAPEVAAELAELRARFAASDHPVDEDPIAYRLTDAAEALPSSEPITPREEDVRPQVRRLRALLAGQRAAVEDPHDSPLHHAYRAGRDLPAPGGTS